MEVDRKEKLTPVQQFYCGKNVFITGATGFLGKLIVEKLLWSCLKIGTIYLLIRDKKGKSVESRVEELTDSAAFHRLKKDFPDFKKKIKAVIGDCALPGLGISEDDRQMLIKEVNIIFHVAATVRFNDPLPYATAVNIRATMDIVNLAKQLKILDSFIYVSTAFANCYSTDLEERFYETPVDAIKLLHFVQSCDPQIVDDLTPKLLNKWPNSYTFTKCLAEDYISKNVPDLPVGVFRPSVVVSSLFEPLPGWVDNWYGLSGFIIAVALGFMRVGRGRKDGIANIVPVDMCVNGLIVAGWDVATKHKQTLQNETIKNKVQLYNFVLGDKKVTWGEVYDVTAHYGENYPPIQAIWHRSLYIQPLECLFRIQRFFLHTVLGYLADGIGYCLGKKPIFRQLYKKLHYSQDTVKFFCMKDWNFTNQNMPKMIETLTEEDKRLYYCDMRTMDWEQFFKTYFLGTRRYLMKEDDSNIPEAKKKYFRLLVLHRLMQLFLIYLLIKLSFAAFNVITTFYN